MNVKFMLHYLITLLRASRATEIKGGNNVPVLHRKVDTNVVRVVNVQRRDGRLHRVFETKVEEGKTVFMAAPINRSGQKVGQAFQVDDLAVLL